MPEMRLHIRRARRMDFTEVMGLCAVSGVPVPTPDRATLRRFRDLVNDLGGDFYLAYFDQHLAGLVHATFARRLAGPPTARIEELIVAVEWRRRGVAASLLAFVLRRARKRGCATLACTPLPGSAAAEPFLEAAGLCPGSRSFTLGLGDNDTA